MMQLQRKVKVEKFFGGVNHKQNSEERELGRSNESLIFEDKLGVSNDVIKEEREEAWNEAHKPAAKPAVKPAAKPAAQPVAKPKETIVVDKAPTKEQVEKLGKQLDDLREKEAPKAQAKDETTNQNKVEKDETGK
jgi:NADH-quinone oxidoreductase subunit B